MIYYMVLATSRWVVIVAEAASMAQAPAGNPQVIFRVQFLGCLVSRDSTWGKTVEMLQRRLGPRAIYRK